MDRLTDSSGVVRFEGALTGPGMPPVSCLLARDVAFNIRQDAPSTGPLWDALYDNPWDLNPLASIPDGIGLTFAFDGTSGLVVPTESGVWALSYWATRAPDADWGGTLRLGVGVDFPWVTPRAAAGFFTDTAFLAGSVVLALPAGTQITHGVVVTVEAVSDPFVCDQMYLAIVRLG